MKNEYWERDFSTAERKSAAKSGAAMKDGSFPIKTVQDLKNAIQAIGRAKNPAAAKAHIKTRARALGATDLLPDNWKEAAPGTIFLKVDLGESLAKSDSYEAIQCAVMNAIRAKIKAGVDMDGDDDGLEDAGHCSACGCVCGQQYGCNCCPECDCSYPETAWCMDIFPAQVIYSMGGKMFQCDYSMDGDEVTLGDPVEVETSYTPVEGEDGTPQESLRALVSESVALNESAYDSSKGVLTVTVIKPGFSKNSTKINGKEARRYYPADTLKRDHKVFEGAKMFANHQTEKEAKERPEGSLRDWVANLGKTWAESDGTVKGTATVIDPPFKAKLDRLNESGLLNEMKVSVRIAGTVSEAAIDGQEACRIDEILGSRSVDFVTFAGAGGQVEAMEADSGSENDVDIVTEAQFRSRRPDLVELIESKQEKQTMKSVEQQLQEAQTKIADLEKKLSASEKASAKAVVSAELTKQLSESKLPEISQNRIRKQFEACEKADGVADAIKAAITEEAEYVTKLGGAPKPVKKNLGTADTGNTEEADKTDTPNLEEAFALLPGMSKDDAKRAATRM